MKAKIDTDHASDTVIQQSQTGFLVFLQGAPIYWYSKKQTSVKSSSFGSEFVAMKQCCKYLCGLQYKLQMVSILCEKTVYIQINNQSVLANTTILDSTLKKKSQSICYHFVCEGVAHDKWLTSYIDNNENETDQLTKIL